MNQEIINQLLSTFGGMEIKISVTKNDKGLEIFGTIMPQNSDGNESEKLEAEAPDACGQEQTGAPAEPEYKYTVRSVKPSGKGSQLLELVARNGEVTAAYIKAGTQPIAVGSRLSDVDIQQKSGMYGNYNLINACRVAA